MGTPVERDGGGGETGFERADQARQFWRNDVAAEMSDAIVPPAAGTIQTDLKLPRCHLPRRREHLRQTRRGEIADEDQGEMQGVGAGSSTATQGMQLRGDGVERIPHRRLWPKREEQPHGPRIHALAIKQTDSAAMPSPRPVNPSFSVVVAFTLT